MWAPQRKRTFSTSRTAFIYANCLFLPPFTRTLFIFFFLMFDLCTFHIPTSFLHNELRYMRCMEYLLALSGFVARKQVSYLCCKKQSRATTIMYSFARAQSYAPSIRIHFGIQHVRSKQVVARRMGI